MNEVLKHKKSASFQLNAYPQFQQQCLLWAQQYELVCFLDSNEDQSNPYGQCAALLAVGQEKELVCWETQGAFEKLKNFYQLTQDWLFGFLSYDLKNDVEALNSRHKAKIALPELHFFKPEIVFEFLDKNEVLLHSETIAPEELFNIIVEMELPKEQVIPPQAIQLQPKIAKEKYLDTVRKIREHIIEGDIYEMNFCQEFYANATVYPLHLFEQLNQLSKSPFAAFYKRKDQYLLCASPERFLRKIGDKVISEPIKGTIKRGNSIAEDQALKQVLYESEKDRAENVMIVDLVRNDLARSCLPGTVKVEELFGIYTFEQVHHMISRITGQLKPSVHFIDLIKNAFPMGSMTGAPKVMSMELIEKYERTKRGLYSGAVGYIRPNGDFDFNVVIRSILYNAKDSYLSFQVGGAIVYDSVPEQEYEECLLKAKGLLKALGI